MVRLTVGQDSEAPVSPEVTPPQLILLPDFISVEAQKELVDWAIAMRPHLNANGASRTFSKVQRLPTVVRAFRRTRVRLQKQLGLPDDIKPEPMFGWYLSIISDGGAVHQHLDGAAPDMRHLRCNLFLQLPDEGGFPIVEDQAIPVQERMILAFFPSEKRHSSQNVKGDRWRIICSFGYLVPKDFELSEVVPGQPYAKDDLVLPRRGRMKMQAPGAARPRAAGDAGAERGDSARTVRFQGRRRPKQDLS